MLERLTLRLYLGLPRYVQIKILYMEARIPQLVSRMHSLTVDAFLRVMESPVSRPQTAFVTSPPPAPLSSNKGFNQSINYMTFVVFW